jgi:small subunit ribosomal protein S3
MGQKVHPFGYRLGPLYTWKSRWFAEQKNYKQQVLQDYKLRRFLYSKLSVAGLNRVDIERSINTIKIALHVSRPGVVIGRGGSNLELLKKDILRLLRINPKDSKGTKVDIKVEEVKNPEMQATLILERLKDQLIKRYPHRRAVAQAQEKALNAGAKGIKIVLSGRIGGAEIGRTEKYTSGTIPTQTLRADIDYAEDPALTKSGYVGIKVYVYKDEGQTS